MKYSNQYGTVDIWPEELTDQKDVIIMLSGGADSTMCTYLLCKAIQERGLDITIHTSTLVAEEKFANALAVLDIRNFLEAEFPDINWGIFDLYYYSENEEPVKKIPNGRANNHARELAGTQLVLSGRTANPPRDIAEANDLMDDRETIRDVEDEEVEIIKYKADKIPAWFAPVQKVDKRWVAEMYREYDLMDSLYKMTASCIGWTYETEHFTKACRHCWWCREKLWAFGSYDGGETPNQQPARLSENRVWVRPLQNKGSTQQRKP